MRARRNAASSHARRPRARRRRTTTTRARRRTRRSSCRHSSRTSLRCWRTARRTDASGRARPFSRPLRRRLCPTSPGCCARSTTCSGARTLRLVTRRSPSRTSRSSSRPRASGTSTMSGPELLATSAVCMRASASLTRRRSRGRKSCPSRSRLSSRPGSTTTLDGAIWSLAAHSVRWSTARRRLRPPTKPATTGGSSTRRFLLRSRSPRAATTRARPTATTRRRKLRSASATTVPCAPSPRQWTNCARDEKAARSNPIAHSRFIARVVYRAHFVTAVCSNCGGHCVRLPLALWCVRNIAL
eukprot:Opistho-1_new@93302